jgi:hypothetical protein
MTAMQLAATVGVCLIVYAAVQLPRVVRQFRRDWRRAGMLLHDARAADPAAAGSDSRETRPGRTARSRRSCTPAGAPTSSSTST